MSRSLASLAAVLAATCTVGCGDNGAEPDAPPDRGAGADAPISLVLDFQPNAVHAGIYVALQRELARSQGLDLQVIQPGASTDAPRLLRSGRADLAVLDVNDLAIAREEDIDLVGVAALVQRPLAAVIAADRELVEEPADLRGLTVGVSGLPSDDAVLATVLAAGGLEPADVETVTIGFDAVPALLGGRLDAATAFWNAEGVLLADRLPTRELRVDELGAPAYPELVLVATPELLTEGRDEVAALVTALTDGYRLVRADPDGAVADLVAAVPGLAPAEQRRQLETLLDAFGPDRTLDRAALEEWARWALEHGIVSEPLRVGAAFDFSVAERG